MSTSNSREKNGKPRKCLCPYCEEELSEGQPLFCQPCGLLLRRCARCLTVLAKEATVCPQCGAQAD